MNQQEFFTCDTRFLYAGIGSKDFFLTEVLFIHEPSESPIMGVCDIGQVSTAKSSMKILLKYFPFVKKEKYTKYFVS